MSTLPKLVRFLTHRLNDAAREGIYSTSTLELRMLLESYETAKDTLDAVPTPYSQGVLEGMRISLCIRAVRYSWHADYDRAWGVVVKSDSPAG